MADSNHTHLAPGTILQGKYQIESTLGQGGFGITYLARDLNLEINLAIKEYMPQDLATRLPGNAEVSIHSGNLRAHYDDGLTKFLQEARTLARFESHPNIVSVRDYFEANQTAYFVMNYIEGITLKEFIRNNEGIISVPQALSVFMPVLDALREVHAYDVLHRDISPDNIFMTAKGQIILIDFGAARQSVSNKGHSMSIILKPGYTPEEQYRSRGLQGPWTDLYALGATFYRAITGQMPVESLDRLAQDDLIPPSALGVAIDAPLEAALLRAMAVKAEDRFQTAADFQAALLGAGTAAAPPSSTASSEAAFEAAAAPPTSGAVSASQQPHAMPPPQPQPQQPPSAGHQTAGLGAAAPSAAAPPTSVSGSVGQAPVPKGKVALIGMVIVGLLLAVLYLAR
ncbi:serine/threonine protein kinase [Anoxynatronum buryatiense]|uniref:Serine/threonine protein kinase n=1 Tax=Anoxynatronum buryatiense TaxID=489973 RepID=A0AA45WXV0_9CLOT|nr:serine/threonine-protein kinase [Anoxynatronum buryatiense]SMP65268.1 Serine/threonine protein kinase [Anoxynatronum buryatiense]